MPAGRIRIGISGWRYEPWRKVFYPADLAQHRELQYASRQLPTIEINGTFYSLQRPEFFQDWHDETPEGFVFEHAPRDPLSLAVTAGGRRFERSLPAGSEPAEVDVEVTAWQTCAVRLEGVQGLPADFHFYVKLNLPGEPLEQTAYAEGREEVRFEVVFPGRYEAYAGAWSVNDGDQRWSETKAVEITPDAPATLTLKVHAP